MEQSLETLLWEAQKVFVRRVDETAKQRAKLMVFTVDQIVRQRVGDRGRKVSGKSVPGWKGEEERKKNGRQGKLPVLQPKS